MRTSQNFLIKIFLAATMFCVTATISMVGQARGKKQGVSLELGAGMPNLAMDNSQLAQTANYRGLAFGARAVVPVYSLGVFVPALTASYNSLDLENSANDELQTEDAEHSGLGVGLRFALSRVFIGAEYHFMNGRHLLVGSVNSQNKFSYAALGYYAGIQISVFDGADLSLAYNISEATVSASEIGSETPLSGSAFWVRLTLSTKSSLIDLLSF